MRGSEGCTIWVWSVKQGKTEQSKMLKRGEVTVALMSRLEISCENKGIVWVPFSSLRNQIPAEPGVSKSQVSLGWPSQGQRTVLGIVSHVRTRRHYLRLSGRMAGSSTIKELEMRILRDLVAYGHESGGVSPPFKS